MITEVQHQFGTVSMIDRTTTITDGKGNVVSEFYTLIVSGRDNNGIMIHAGHLRCAHKYRHMNRKDRWITKLQGTIKSKRHESTQADVLAGL